MFMGEGQALTLRQAQVERYEIRADRGLTKTA